MAEAKEVIVEVPEGYTEEDLSEALALLESSRAKKVKQTEKRREQMKDPEFAAAMKKTHLRYQAKRNILIRKAIEAGFGATDEEVDAEMSGK